MPSLYDILEISNNADESEIKRAYFKLIRTYTPEKQPEKFKEIRKAYATLSDKKSKEEYDKNFSVPEKYLEKYLEAKQLMEEHKLKEALKILKSINLNVPNSLQVKLELGKAYILNNNFGNAQRLFEGLAHEDPSNQDYVIQIARVYSLRGHKNKANEQYKKALDLDKRNPIVWIEYLNFTGEHFRWHFANVLKEAESVSPDIFKDHYYIYMRACMVADEGLYINIDYVARIFEKFAKYFAADERAHKPEKYESAIDMAHDLSAYSECLEGAKIILPALEAYELKTDNQKNQLKEIRINILFSKLADDPNIDEVIKDLTYFLLEDEKSSEAAFNIFVHETKVLMEIQIFRKSLKLLREKYPEHYNLNRQFYDDALDLKNFKRLRDTYFNKYKELRKKNPELFDDSDYFDFEQPYTREAPKIGRNDPCPCGSGKKYKKCCGN